MAMTCRRCEGKIKAGEVANVIRSVIVGECCRRPDERGFTDGVGEPMPERATATPPVVNEVGSLSVTRRRMEILQLAEDGLVTRQGNLVNAFDREAGKMRDSKSVAEMLKRHGLAYWEKLPVQGFLRESPRWVLKLTPEGRDWLAYAEMKREALDAV